MRRIYVQDPKTGDLYEVPSDYVPSRDAKKVNPLAGDRHYDGLRATDGTPIDTRSKHRAYMRERGLTTIDDFTGHAWPEARKKRDEFFTTGRDGDRRDVIEEAFFHSVDTGDAHGRRKR